MKKIPTLEDAGDLKGKRVLLRLDLNAPVADGKVTETYRLDKSLPILDDLHLKGAKVIIIAHIETKDNPTLLPVWEYMHGFLPIKFSPTYFTKEADTMVSNLEDGEVMMFENVRMNPGEKSNDMEFAKKLAAYGDIYVNDAFAVSHREQASIVLVPTLLPHYAGPLFMDEVNNLSKAFNPPHPFLFVLGGAKFETKLPLIQKFLKSADTIFVGGALANDVFKAKGYEIGTSLVSQGDFGIEKLLQEPNFKYPIDVTVSASIAEASATEVTFKDADQVSKDEYIGDVGPKTIEMLREAANNSKFILWNGPLGNFEIGFNDKTEQLAELIANSGAETIVGGGDTLASIQKLNLLEKFSFVSTAGGAMLDFLANETLPGIEALTN